MRETSQKLKYQFAYVADMLKRLFLVVLKTLSLQEIKEIFKEFFRDDIWENVKTYGIAFKEISKRALIGIMGSISNIKEKGLDSCLKEIARKIKNNIETLGRTFNTTWTHLRSLDTKGKILLLSKILFFAFATYCGYKIPDLDIWFWGIGSHRHFSTHSIIPIIAITLIGKLINRILTHVSQNSGPNDSDIKIILQEVKNFINVFVAGAACGISLHLFEDLFIDGSQTIRGLPWDRESLPDFLRKNYRFDDGYLLVNDLIGGAYIYKRMASLDQE